MTLGVNEKIYFYVNKAFKKIYKSDKMKKAQYSKKRSRSMKIRAVSALFSSKRETITA